MANKDLERKPNGLQQFGGVLALGISSFMMIPGGLTLGAAATSANLILMINGLMIFILGLLQIQFFF
ncbi:MAG: hypothetical protein HWN66_10650 [Candidatus Helarchaeota archaeon]|nr:hypothetical protein [Candidatus Helarchaeota archaeon]